MTLDLTKIKSDAEKIAANSDLLLMALPVKDVLGMLAEIDQLKIALDMESAELAWSDSDGREIQAQRDQLKAENEALRKAVKFSVDEFENITSGDGSGHADLARAVKRIAGVAFLEEKE